MLNNKDFRNILSTVASNGNNNSDKNDKKIRFDLKQVKQWDQQIQKKLYGNEKKSKSVNDTDFDSKPGDTVNGFKKKKEQTSMYRDRALERRQNEGKETSELEIIASKLDAEQTKFLGIALFSI